MHLLHLLAELSALKLLCYCRPTSTAAIALVKFVLECCCTYTKRGVPVKKFAEIKWKIATAIAAIFARPCKFCKFATILYLYHSLYILFTIAVVATVHVDPFTAHCCWYYRWNDVGLLHILVWSYCLYLCCNCRCWAFCWIFCYFDTAVLHLLLLLSPALFL